MVTRVLLLLVFVTLIGISDGASERICPLTRLSVDTAGGYISFPSHQDKSVRDCRWILEATRDEWNIKIQVLRSNLDVGWDGDCQNSASYVELFEMPERTTYGYFCGDERLTFYSTTKRVFIRYLADSPLNNQGFELQYSAGIFPSIGDEIIDTRNYRAEKSPEVFSQPYFSSSENKKFVKEAWRIRSDDPDKEIFVRAISLSLPEDVCAFEYIELFNGEDQNGPSLGKWCGTETPEKIVVKGTVYIVLNVRNFDSDTTFQIEYGIEERNAIPMIAGIFVGVIVFIALVFIVGKMLCSKYSNSDESDDESEVEPTPANQTLLSDVSTRDDPPRFSSLNASAPPYSELSPPAPSAPSADVTLHPPEDHPSAPPPSYEDVIKSPLSYNDPSTQTV